MKRAPAPILAAVTACLMMPLVMARAETVLRLDNASPAQLDPDKGMDYSASILAFNVYDTLVGAQQGGEGVIPSLAQSWTIDKTSYVFTLRAGREVPQRQRADRG